MIKNACFKLLPALLLLAAVAAAQEGRPWSVRMADSVMGRQPRATQIEQRTPADTPKWSYSAALLVRAVGEVGRKTSGKKYLDYAKDYVDCFVNDQGVIDPKQYKPSDFKLDDIAPGRLVLLVYQSTSQEKYKKAAETLARQFKDQPRTAEGGFWHKKIYPRQMWLDGIYMGCPFAAQCGALLNQPALFDEAARQITLIAAHTQDPASGLCYHGWDESRAEKWSDPATGLSKCFWGRALGWYVMGIVDTLDALPAQHARRGELLGILKKAAAGIEKVQDPASGLWWQVLDRGGATGNYREASASCMFVYALARGVRKGYLEQHYLAVAKKGYAGILKELIVADPAGEGVSLKDTCAVAGLGGRPYRDGSYEYYIGEPKALNDPKGLGPFILASLELEQ